MILFAAAKIAVRRCRKVPAAAGNTAMLALPFGVKSAIEIPKKNFTERISLHLGYIFVLFAVK